jgi:hypothetical protein
MPPPPKKPGLPGRPDFSKDLDHDGDIDAGDNRIDDLNHDGRIDGSDSEALDLDHDNDIDGKDRVIEEQAPEEKESVGARLGWSKAGDTWTRPEAPSRDVGSPSQGVKR